ncbi:hypothetical protein ECFDA506_3401, partial [Escherichia coli FDA506]
MATVITSG